MFTSGQSGNSGNVETGHLDDVHQEKGSSGGDGAEIGLFRVEKRSQTAAFDGLERLGQIQLVRVGQLWHLDEEMVRFGLSEQMIPSVFLIGQTRFQIGQAALLLLIVNCQSLLVDVIIDGNVVRHAPHDRFGSTVCWR